MHSSCTVSNLEDSFSSASDGVKSTTDLCNLEDSCLRPALVHDPNTLALEFVESVKLCVASVTLDVTLRVPLGVTGVILVVTLCVNFDTTLVTAIGLEIFFVLADGVTLSSSSVTIGVSD